jgi:thiol-disulfide isomerase/thioredoxin
MTDRHGITRAPDFPAQLEWLNAEQPLRLADLRGKVVLLDFWTYCCINCMHVIPDLKRLEAKYPDTLVVIGIHSGKFSAERETSNIRAAILRYGIEHPVVNDRDTQVWQLYGVRAWPTLVLLDPEGRIVFRKSGEGAFEAFDGAIAELVEQYETRGLLDHRPLDFGPLTEDGDSILSFPGKVLADTHSRRLFVSDTNHNRIVIAALDDGLVLDIIGAGMSGLTDGAFEEATFDHPQGLALEGDALYLADTENHALRRADLVQRRVATIAGTGGQTTTFNRSGPGPATSLNSPWDLVVHDNVLYIAMAGSHQLWRMDLKTGYIQPHAGSGREGRIDGPLAVAALAQPSGLATDGIRLYFADSEVSAIRSADLRPDGRVETIVGGDLFEFGDQDGQGLDVRLQHPLGISYRSGVLYVADTYNNKIKRVRLRDRTCETLFGTGEPGRADGEHATFFEAGGLSLGGEMLYIADTNNHAIRVADLSTGGVETLDLRLEEAAPPGEAAPAEFAGEMIQLPRQSLNAGENTLTLNVALPARWKVNPEAPLAIDLFSSDERILSVSETALRNPRLPAEVRFTARPGEVTLTAEFALYCCRVDGGSLCNFKQIRLVAPIEVGEDGGESALALTYTVAPEE